VQLLVQVQQLTLTPQQHQQQQHLQNHVRGLAQVACLPHATDLWTWLNQTPLLQLPPPASHLTYLLLLPLLFLLLLLVQLQVPLDCWASVWCLWVLLTVHGLPAAVCSLLRRAPCLMQLPLLLLLLLQRKKPSCYVHWKQQKLLLPLQPLQLHVLLSPPLPPPPAAASAAAAAAAALTAAATASKHPHQYLLMLTTP
jgi:hypothetical protein